MGDKRVRVDIMIGRSLAMCVLFAMWYFVLVLENKKLCLGRMCGSVHGVHVSVLLCVV